MLHIGQCEKHTWHQIGTRGRCAAFCPLDGNIPNTSVMILEFQWEACGVGFIQALHKVPKGGLQPQIPRPQRLDLEDAKEQHVFGPRSIPRKAASMSLGKCVPKKRGQLNCCSQNSSVWQSLRIDAAQNSMFKAAECALFAAQPHQIQDLVDVTCRNRTNIISLIKPHESTDQCFRGANVTRRRSGARPSVPARLPAAGKYFSTCYTTCLCYMLTCKKNKFQHVRQKSTVIEKFVQDALYATKR